MLTLTFTRVGGSFRAGGHVRQWRGTLYIFRRLVDVLVQDAVQRAIRCLYAASNIVRDLNVTFHLDSY